MSHHVSHSISARFSCDLDPVLQSPACLSLVAFSIPETDVVVSET